jgi:hypothetical protein
MDFKKDFMEEQLSGLGSLFGVLLYTFGNEVLLEDIKHFC